MIHVENLVKTHGVHRILDGISLNIRRGEVAAIIGPSGSGKSTFLRCLNGLEPIQGGTIRIGDADLGANLVAVRQKLGFVFQQFNLFPHLTVVENCVLGPLQVRKEGRAEATARVEALLARVGLTEKAHQLPRKLSGGQQQRAAIVRALAMEPEAILFDEPTSALDPVMAAEVMSVITDLAKQGQTMLVVTHSMSFAQSVAKKVYVFAAGKVVESGPPAQLFTNPQHEVTRALISS